MKMKRVRLRDYMHGSVTHAVIEGQQDVFWGKTCSLCDGQFRIGNVVVNLQRYRYTESIAICGTCLAAIYEQMPPDSSDRRVQEVAHKSTLVGWINDLDPSMKEAL